MSSFVNGLTKVRSKLTKFKGIGKLNQYLESLWFDYKSVAEDTWASCKRRPVRASIVLSVMGLGGLAVKRQPSLVDFNDQLLAAQNQLIILSDAIRNPYSNQYVQDCVQLINSRRLNHWNLIFFSLLYETDYNADSGLYPAKCQYLTPSYWSILTERVIDVGVWGNWLNLRKRMKDFDINPDEWAPKQ